MQIFNGNYITLFKNESGSTVECIFIIQFSGKRQNVKTERTDGRLQCCCLLWYRKTFIHVFTRRLFLSNQDTARQLYLSDFEQGSRPQKYFLFEVAACRETVAIPIMLTKNTTIDDALKRHILLMCLSYKPSVLLY